ncbi:hypothetical protein, partial [Methylobacterium aquaticum]
NTASLRGPAGAGTALRISGGFVQWKRDDVADWSNLVAVAALTGADGRAAELRVQGTALQARQLGADWATIFDLSSLSAVVDVEGLKRRILDINAGVYPAERPGDNPSAFTASRAGGDPTALPAIDTTLYPVRTVGDGLGLEISSSREVWERTLHVVESTRLWRGRWRYVRTQAAQDPENDSVVALVQWYGPDRTSPVGGTVTVEAFTPGVNAPHEVSAFIGISGLTGVTVARPAGASYFRVGLRSYGVESRTVLTDLHAADVSDIEEAIRRLVPEDGLPNLSAKIDETRRALDAEVVRSEAVDGAHETRLDTIDTQRATTFDVATLRLLGPALADGDDAPYAAALISTMERAFLAAWRDGTIE